jgi:hypothetical protein
MKLIKFTTSVVALSVLGLTACHGGPEGTYKLDKTEMKKAMEAKIAKLPKEQQAFAGMATAMIEALNVQLKLESGGKAEITTSMSGMDKGSDKAKTESGTWRKDGNKVILTNKGKDTTCEQDGKELKCPGDHPDDPPMVFVKS